MFGARYILIVVIFIFFEYSYLVSSPIEDTDILKAESAIRKTANDLFHSLGVRNLQEIPRLHQHALVHNYFISLTLQGYIHQREITKLTRVDKGNKENGSADFIAILNEIQNEDNVLKLQSMLMGEDARIGYDVKAELEKLEYLKKYHEYHNNRSAELKINVSRISEEGESLEVYNITTPEGNNDSDSDIEFWDEDEKVPERRIYGGKRTKRKHYPFIASVQIFGKFQCAGSIIKSDLVITAASCLQLAWNNRFYRENPQFLSVRVGSSYYEVGGESIDVLEVYFYPSYNPKNLRHNLAIMRLYRHIKMKRRKVQKIQIGGEISKNAGRVLVVGWGAYTVGNTLHNPWEDKLRYAELDQYPLDDCQDIYSKDYVTQSNFCAGFISIGTGACNRDAGGPGVMSGKLAGVISFGAPLCGTPDNPTVFTKLSYYEDWIEEIMEQPVPMIQQRTTFKPQTYAYSSVSHKFFDRFKGFTPIVSMNPLAYNIQGAPIELTPVTQIFSNINRLHGKHQRLEAQDNSRLPQNNPRQDAVISLQQKSIQLKETFDEPMSKTANVPNFPTTTPGSLSMSVTNENVNDFQPTVMDYKEKLDYDMMQSIKAVHNGFADQAKIEPLRVDIKVKKRKKSKKRHKPGILNLVKKNLSADPNNPGTETNIQKPKHPERFIEAYEASRIANKGRKKHKFLQPERMNKPELEDLTRARQKAEEDQAKSPKLWDLSTESQEDESEVFHDSLQSYAYRSPANITLPVEKDITTPTNTIPDKPNINQVQPLLQTNIPNTQKIEYHQVLRKKQEDSETPAIPQEVEKLDYKEFLGEVTEDNEQAYNFIPGSQEVKQINQVNMTQEQKEAILNYQVLIPPPQIEKSVYQELLAFQEHLSKAEAGVKLDNHSHSIQTKGKKAITYQRNMTNTGKNDTKYEKEIELAKQTNPSLGDRAKLANHNRLVRAEESVELSDPIENKFTKLMNQDNVVQDDKFANRELSFDDNEDAPKVASQDIPIQAQDKRKLFNQETVLVDQAIPIRDQDEGQDEAASGDEDFLPQYQEVDLSESPGQQEDDKLGDLDYSTEIQEKNRTENGEIADQGNIRESVETDYEKVPKQIKEEIKADFSKFSIPDEQVTKSDQQKMLAQVQNEINLVRQNVGKLAMPKGATIQANQYQLITQNSGLDVVPSQALPDYQELLAYQKLLAQTIGPIDTIEKHNSPLHEVMTQKTIKPVDQKLSTYDQDIARAYQLLFKKAEEASNLISTTKTNELSVNVLRPTDQLKMALEDMEKAHIANLTTFNLLLKKSTDQENDKSGKHLNKMEMEVKSVLDSEMDNAVHSLLSSSSNQNSSNIKTEGNISSFPLGKINVNVNAVSLRIGAEDKTKDNEKVQSTNPQLHIFRNSVFKKKDVAKLIALFKATSKIEQSFRSDKKNETSLYEKYREFLGLYKDTLEGSDFENASKEKIYEGLVRRSMNVDNETIYSDDEDDNDNTTEVSSTIGASEAADIKRNVLDYINI